jgi:hypothetical protein
MATATPIIIGIAGLAVAACGGSAPSAEAGITLPAAPVTVVTPTPSGTASSDRPLTVRDPNADLEVEDQVGDGRTVLVDEVEASVPGFVAVWTLDGSLLGSAPVRPDTVLIRVRLDADAGNRELRAVLYRDDGDGRFDPATDPIVTESGERVQETFEYRTA